MSMPTPFTEAEMLNLAASAIAQIDARGRRGTEMLTYDQIEAMALTLALVGIPTPQPKETSPNDTA